MGRLRKRDREVMKRISQPCDPRRNPEGTAYLKDYICRSKRLEGHASDDVIDQTLLCDYIAELHERYRLLPLNVEISHDAARVEPERGRFKMDVYTYEDGGFSHGLGTAYGDTIQEVLMKAIAIVMLARRAGRLEER